MATPKPQKYVPVFFMSSATMAAMTNLTDDGLTQWHPAFLQLGNNLEDCARKYRGFCKRYNPKSKPARKCNWGNKLLAGLDLKGGKRSGKPQTLTASSAPPTPSSARYPKARWYQQLRLNSSGLTRLLDGSQGSFEGKRSSG
jgi:putative transposase